MLMVSLCPAEAVESSAIQLLGVREINQNSVKFPFLAVIVIQV